MIEESAALKESDVNELIELSSSAVKQGTTSKAEVEDLLQEAKQVTREPKNLEQEPAEISEDEVNALLRQLRNRSENIEEKESNMLKEFLVPSEVREPAQVADDSVEIEAILSQLTDAVHLEKSTEESDSESELPSVSGFSLPSVPNEIRSTDDDLKARIASLKSSFPKNYTGRDLGSINVFVPGLSSAEEDDVIHWCG